VRRSFARLTEALIWMPAEGGELDQGIPRIRRSCARRRESIPNRTVARGARAARDPRFGELGMWVALVVPLLATHGLNHSDRARLAEADPIDGAPSWVDREECAGGRRQYGRMTRADGRCPRCRYNPPMTCNGAAGWRTVERLGKGWSVESEVRVEGRRCRRQNRPTCYGPRLVRAERGRV
jgi:hypothetical protein